MSGGRFRIEGSHDALSSEPLALGWPSCSENSQGQRLPCAQARADSREVFGVAGRTRAGCAVRGPHLAQDRRRGLSPEVAGSSPVAPAHSADAITMNGIGGSLTRLSPQATCHARPQERDSGLIHSAQPRHGVAPKRDPAGTNSPPADAAGSDAPRRALLLHVLLQGFEPDDYRIGAAFDGACNERVSGMLGEGELCSLFGRLADAGGVGEPLRVVVCLVPDDWFPAHANRESQPSRTAVRPAPWLLVIRRESGAVSAAQVALSSALSQLR